MARRLSSVNWNVPLYIFFGIWVGIMLYSKVLSRFYTEEYDAAFRETHNDIRNEGLSYKSCIMKQLGEGVYNKEKFWHTLKPAVETCTKESKFGKLPIASYNNKDETKHYLHDFVIKEKETPDRTLMQKSIVLTLGVGKDITVEEKLKGLLSNESEFFAADPMLENDALFTPIGLFFPFAVGKTTGISNASVLTEGYTVYKTLTMMHIDIMTFLTRIIRRDKIDQFLMDNEGPEYDIQPMMAKGKEFDKAGITICQINGEYHGGFLPQLHTVLVELFKDNRFIPLRIVQGNHVRLFMVNIESQYCVKRYLAQHFTD